MPTSTNLTLRGDLNLFRIFLAVAQEGSTVKAAERLHVSQSAVSHAIARLRELLNDPVFIKQGRRLVLSPHARSILPRIEASINELAACAVPAQTFSPATSQIEFKLGFRDIVEFLVLPELMGHLRQQGSRLCFASTRVATHAVEESLMGGQLDAAIDLQYPVSQNIASIQIAKEPLCIVVGRRRKEYEQTEISLQSYIEGEHALVALAPTERIFIEQSMGAIGQQRKVILHCEHYHAAVRVVAATDLLLTMPYSYAHYLADWNDVRLLPLPFSCEELPIRLYWRKDLSEEPAIQWLVETLPGILQNVLPDRLFSNK